MNIDEEEQQKKKDKSAAFQGSGFKLGDSEGPSVQIRGRARDQLSEKVCNSSCASTVLLWVCQCAGVYIVQCISYPRPCRGQQVYYSVGLFVCDMWVYSLGYHSAVFTVWIAFTQQAITVYLLIYRTAKNNYFRNGIIGTDFYRACEVSGIIRTSKQLHVS